MSTHRVSGRQLAQRKDRLSGRDLAVLETICSYRLISGVQIARLHFEGHATDDAGARVCRLVMKRLTDRGLVARLDRRVGGIRAGSSGFVYTISPVGHRLLGSPIRKRSTEPTFAFLQHMLAIAELATRLHAHCDEEGIELLDVEPEPAAWRAFTDGLIETTLKPDLALRTADTEYELIWFIEIDCGTESRPTIQRKCQVYGAYCRSGIEQRRHGVFPRTLWVAPDEDRARQIRQAIESADVQSSLFAVTTAEKPIDVLTNFDASGHA